MLALCVVSNLFGGSSVFLGHKCMNHCINFMFNEIFVFATINIISTYVTKK